MNETVETTLLTASELAARWRLSRGTVYNLLTDGLPSVKIGRARRFRPADVDAWLAARNPSAA